MAKHAVSLAPALAKKPRRRLPSNVVACMIGRDRNLTELWREHGEIPARLAGNGFASVISPAFSTWHNVPALDGLYSVARSMAVTSLLSEKLPTIPTIVWRTGRDIERQIRWLELDSIGEAAIAVDLAARAPPHFDWLLERIRFMARHAASGAQVRLVAIGVFRRERMAAVARVWPGPITFGSSAAYHKGRCGVLLADGGGKNVRTSADRRDVYMENMARLDGWAEEVLTARFAVAA